MAIRTASARWQGTLTDGTGIMRTGTGGYEGAYSFRSRFEEGEGSNPEELIGAAHAGCFSMALAKELTDAGYPPATITTGAEVHLIKIDGQQTIARIDLHTTGNVPGISEDLFAELADRTKLGCPVSRLLAPGTEITLTATLVAA